MTTEDIRAELQQNIDEKYRAFHASLVPGIGTFLGVRVPKMREIAKKAAKEDYQTFFAEADVSVYEELMIRGMIPGYAKLTIKQRKQELERFVPYINNWAVCDCCCVTYKFMKKDQDERLKRCLEKWLQKKVVIKYTIKPEILGGLLVECGSIMFDDSLKGKLEKLELLMKGTK